MSKPHWWDIVVVGSVNTDYLVRADRMPLPGETVKGDEFLTTQGGKGANQAVAAARLGARVALVAKLGADERGDAAIANLRRAGVDTRYVIRDAEVGTGAALIIVDNSGEKHIISVSNANKHLTVAEVQAAAEAISHARVVISQLEVPLECVQEAARLADEAGAQMLLDPAPAIPLPDDLLRMVSVIKPNDIEALTLTGVTIYDRATAREAAQALLNRGVRAVAAPTGEAGNLLVWENGELWLPRIPVKSVDATGAGDAFIAALGVMLAEGKSLAEAGPFASAAAALTTTQFGAQNGLTSRDAVQELLNQITMGDSTQPEK